MSKLSEFLMTNKVQDLTKEVELTGRLEGMTFTIKTMTGEDYDNYSRVSQKIVGKEIKIDSNKLRMMILKNHILDPDFKSEELLKGAGATTPEQFIQERLTIGEQIKLQEAILDLSGMNTDINTDVENAKN